jgi:haloacetate dehalogenase
MTTHPQSERIQEGLSRRSVVHALSLAAAASVATPLLAQQTALLAEATSADYVRDPTRWGRAELAALFPGFKHLDIRTRGAVIRLRHGGSGPPLLLLHGNSQNHATWFGVAARLAERYHVVLPDLRGYGDSSLPDPGPNHINYSSGVLGGDMFDVMDSLGHQRFFLAGHDRGAHVTYRMCLDQPDRIMKVCILDVLPSYHAWTNLNMRSALNAWHWQFLAQPEPLPNTLISAVPAEWFLKSRGYDKELPKVVFDDYVRCFTNKTILGACRHYRANATIDFETSMAEKDRKMTPPFLALWGTRGAPPTQEFPTVWRRFASNLVDAQPLPTGHALQVEAPDRVYDHFVKFFQA